MAYKHTNRTECYRLYVEEGITEVSELARRSGLSATTVRSILTKEARLDHQARVREAKRVYVENGVSDVNAICAQAKIHKNLFFKVYDNTWDDERAKRVAENPVLYRTAELLRQAAEQLLVSVKTSGYKDQSVSRLISLSNSFEKFRTGEFQLEMIMLGMTHFAEWFRDNASRIGLKAREVKALQQAIDQYRRSIVDRLEQSA